MGNHVQFWNIKPDRKGGAGVRVGFRVGVRVGVRVFFQIGVRVAVIWVELDGRCELVDSGQGVASCEQAALMLSITKMKVVGDHRVVHGSDGPAGRVGSRFCRIFGGSGRVRTSDFKVFYCLFLGTWIDMNLRILHSDWLIFIDI